MKKTQSKTKIPILGLHSQHSCILALFWYNDAYISTVVVLMKFLIEQKEGLLG